MIGTIMRIITSSSPTNTYHIETKCILIRHYVAKQKLHRAKRIASMPENQFFKAKTTEEGKGCRNSDQSQEKT